MSSPHPYEETRPSGFHPVSTGHLTTGVAVLGLVGAWALWQFGPAGNDDVRWLVAAPWVLAGLVGLVASAVTGGRRHRTHGPVEPGWVGVSDRPTEQPSASDRPEEQP
ncbi:hypothetical protein [Nocardioides flavescens]|uniref:DUF2530 domain-containing protein n=1 Tax=Nocardioides flavescens TaxID=2691959 RepID=A0A6L7EPY7_9ACTN|nr:hypothetical protein [Nocardioides flavescens]MXG89437.1 hypothetical protein [Nocardioides flavescens]